MFGVLQRSGHSTRPGLCCPSFTRRSSPDALASLPEHVLALVAAVGLAALGGEIGCDGRALRKESSHR